MKAARELITLFRFPSLRHLEWNMYLFFCLSHLICNKPSFLHFFSMSGYVLMVSGVDLALPCVLCLSRKAGHGDSYLQADLTPAMLHTHLLPRLRQHFKREHDFGARDPEAENYKSHAKRLVCRRLHSQFIRLDSAPEFLSVSCVLNNYFGYSLYSDWLFLSSISLSINV